MPRKSIQQLLTRLGTDFPDNDTGLITPEILRLFLTDFLDTIQPGYGIVALETPPVSQSFTTTPQVVTAYDSTLLATEPFTTDPQAGTVTAQIDIAASVNFVSSVEFSNGDRLRVQIYRNGQPVVYAGEAQGLGNNDPVPLSTGAGIIELQTNDVLDARIDVQSAGSMQFNELYLIVTAIPLRDIINPHPRFI